MNQGKKLSAVFQRSRFVNIKGQLYDFAQPKIMGILNITPDSFYEESRVQSTDELLTRAAALIEQGCDIIDIGASSTRPGAAVLTADQEIERLGTCISQLKKAFPTTLISLDTYFSEVAQYGIEEGCDLINDISAGQFDPKLWDVVAAAQLPYILTYNRANANNQAESYLKNKGILSDALSFLSEKIQLLQEKGITDVILDPGFGFGKTLEENHQLLQQLEHLQILGCPLLIGVSRKSMITKKLNIDASAALNGTSILNTIAYTKGASIFRVHDIEATQQMISLL
ncbi:MAG: dihydropteroate synthase, partial [Flavobacteriales bacterium]